MDDAKSAAKVSLGSVRVRGGSGAAARSVIQAATGGLEAGIAQVGAGGGGPTACLDLKIRLPHGARPADIERALERAIIQAIKGTTR
jgi:hypothetical protein